MHALKELRERARAAADKPAPYGSDLDLGAYVGAAPERSYVDSLEQLEELGEEELARAGVEKSGRRRSGSFVQIDGSVVHRKALEKGLEILSTREALEKYDWIWDYYWKAVAVDADKYTAAVELGPFEGYFMRALPGSRTIYPLQACLYIRQPRFAQRVHNIIIAEEGSELHIITGCASEHEIRAGLHLGVSEFYVKKNARITFTMVHNWAEGMDVRPRSGIVVEEGGLFMSNYVVMEPVKSLQLYPTARLVGEGATARFHSILVAQPGSELDVGSRVILGAPRCSAEIISRAITKGGYIAARGHIRGEVGGVKAHLECRGLILDGRGVIHAVPELEGRAEDVDMSHEAAVGKIAQEEVEYLMARGLSEEEAVSTIVRGFLNVKIEGLPPLLEQEMRRMMELSEEKAL
ncbi:SufB/SufD family protein [Candidatus Solincola sp.]|jgi:Fe-S cluster assembly scaffold protein SufB|nr:SufD family Fe-S cluster assembly protein [Actinomycetota bacterium]MDI7251559.1 SufD family Fe-S cluster assembly protein [Actinomycetota bacterium]